MSKAAHPSSTEKTVSKKNKLLGFLRRFIRAIIIASAIIIVLFAVLISIMRGLTPYLSQHKQEISTWLSQAFNEPIVIGRVNASWSGLHPVLQFHDLTVLNKSRDKSRLHIKNLTIQIDVLRSLLDWEVRLGNVSLSGMTLTIRSDKTGELSVDGFLRMTDQYPWQDPQTVAFFYQFHWLRLDDITLRWIHDGAKPVILSNVSIILNNNDGSHRVSLSGVIAQKVLTALNIKAKWRGQLDNISSINAKTYLSVKNISFNQWQGLYHDLPITVKNGQGNLALWASIKRGKLMKLQTTFHLKNLHVDISRLGKYLQKKKTFKKSLVRLSKPVMIESLSGNVLWHKTADGWRSSGDNLKLQMDGDDWPTDKFLIISEKDNHQILIKYLAVKDSLPILYDSQTLPPKLIKLLKHINPAGIITNVIVKHEDDDYDLEGGFKNLSFNRWKNIPGAKNLFGHIIINPHDGNAQIRSKKTLIDFGKLFIAPQKIADFKTDLRWYRTPTGWMLNVGDISGHNQDDKFVGELSLFFPKGGGDPVINLLAGGHAKDARNLKYMLPVGILRPALVKWLNQSIKKARNARATVILRGPISTFPFDKGAGVFLVDSQVSDVSLKYQPDWPIITGISDDMVFDGRTMTITAHSGKIYNANIKKATVLLPRIGKDVNERLDIHAEVDGDLDDGLKFIINSPLKKYIGEDFRKIKLTGPMKVKLELQIPIGKGDQNAFVKGKVLMSQGKIAARWGLSLDDINGALQFTENTIAAKNLKARLFNHPAIINISTVKNKKGKVTIADLTGDISATAIKKYLHIPDFKYVTGKTGYQLQLKLSSPGSKIANQINFTSNLRGLSVTLPAPLGKTSKQSVKSEASISFLQAKPIKIKFHYGANVKGAVLLSNKKPAPKFQKGNIHFGKGKAVYPKKSKLLIDGKLNSFDLAAWRKVFATGTNSKDVNNQMIKKYLRLVSVSIARLKVMGRTFHNMAVALAPYPSFWHVKLTSKAIAGVITLPYNIKHGVIKANFSRLYLKSSSLDKSTATLDPRSVPAFLLSANSFKLNQLNLGKIYLKLSPIVGGVKIDSFKSETPFYSTNIFGAWTISKEAKGKRIQTTSLEGQIKSTDIAKTLKSWGLTPDVHGKEGNLLFSISWPGMPFEPNMAKLYGNMSITMREGNIVDISKETQEKIGVGKVLTLFNLQTLPQKLRLDFSDLSSKGYYFKIMKGNFAIFNGQAITKNTYFNGPVAKILLRGNVGLAKKDLNMKIVISPYLTSSLPVLATIVGGPVAGVAAWLVDKIISPGIQKAVSYTYLLTGSWAKPTLTKVEDKVNIR